MNKLLTSETKGQILATICIILVNPMTLLQSAAADRIQYAAETATCEAVSARCADSIDF